jgi:hypothetical protein
VFAEQDYGLIEGCGGGVVDPVHGSGDQRV